MGLKLTYMGLNLTYMGLNLTYMRLSKMCHLLAQDLAHFDETFGGINFVCMYV